ncbi:hypothetical protein LTR95_014920 [Oleoguttula sp. CCFEE 5521]
MSSEQILPASDLRSAAQDSKRDAARKAKWSLGAIERAGRGEGNPRPLRPSDTRITADRRADKGVSALQQIAKTASRRDLKDGQSYAATSDESSGYDSDHVDAADAAPSPTGNVEVMYSFDAPRGPIQGSQILNMKLAQAVEKFEERETVKLVKTEWDVLDTEGEVVAASPMKKEKRVKKAPVPAPRVPDADEDYEFI